MTIVNSFLKICQVLRSKRLVPTGYIHVKTPALNVKTVIASYGFVKHKTEIIFAKLPIYA